MHLRRALLLFAIVLALAALATSVTREDEDKPREPAQTGPKAPARAGPATPPARVRRVRLTTRGASAVRAVPAGEPLELSVMVERAGLVEIPGLGLSAPAEPGTPARFDLLRTEPGRFEALVRPAAGGRPERIGALVFQR